MSSTDTLAADLAQIFGQRMRMLAVFGNDTHTCAVVETLTLDDLDRCAAMDARWKQLRLDTPLFLIEGDLPRALDAFPLELSEIIATRQIIAGSDVFTGLSIAKADLRRACEVQARAHLLHLREGYIEAAGDARQVDSLVAAAAPPFRALLINAARLDDVTPQDFVTTLGVGNFESGFPAALRAAERLVEYVDRWVR
jgi:hypothetical protein